MEHTIVRVVVNDAFHALANPVRREIVERLASGPCTVGVATRDLAVSKPAISRHVRVLEDADLVSRSVHGRTHVLTLNPAALDDPRDWIDRQRAIWERLFNAVEDQSGTHLPAAASRIAQ